MRDEGTAKEEYAHTLVVAAVADGKDNFLKGKGWELELELELELVQEDIGDRRAQGGGGQVWTHVRRGEGRDG